MRTAVILAAASMTRSYIKHGFTGDENNLSLDWSVPPSADWNTRFSVCVGSAETVMVRSSRQELCFTPAPRLLQMRVVKVNESANLAELALLNHANPVVLL